MTNTLYYGDNLDILRRYIKDESVNLIYLDPPFNSNQDYNVLFKEKDGAQAASQIRAFKDTWTWDQEAEAAYADLIMTTGKVADVMQAFRMYLNPCDLLAYLVMMAPRLIELRRVLKDSGSIYLHCDPAASHYLKMLLDAVFGPERFRNEIIWKRTSGHSDAIGYGSVHDTILFYTKMEKALWNETYQPYDDEYIKQYYRYTDEKGRRFMSGDLGAAGLQGGGYDYEWKGVQRVWRVPFKTMEELDRDGRIFYTKNGIPRRKRYLDESKGLPAQDLWTDIQALRSWHQERLGYPTQKPIALLERIIRASSDEGDVVLDPFCGCGTTIAASQALHRQWIGIDITHLAMTLMKERIKDTFGDNTQFSVVGEPVSIPDAVALAASNPYQFQWWALGLVGARPVEEKKGADKGIDGKIVFQGDTVGRFESVILSVKAGHVTVNQVRDLRGVLDREKAAIGVLISMEDATKPMQIEAATAGFFDSAMWNRRYPKMQLLTIMDLLAGKQIDMPPVRQVGATFKKAPKVLSKGTETRELPLMEDSE